MDRDAPTLAALAAPGQPWRTHLDLGTVMVGPGGVAEAIVVYPGGYLYAVHLELRGPAGTSPIFRIGDHARARLMFGAVVEFSMLPLARMDAQGYGFSWHLTRPHDDIRDAFNTAMLVNGRVLLDDLPSEVTEVAYTLYHLVPVRTEEDAQ